jgi:hypothetical protein
MGVVIMTGGTSGARSRGGKTARRDWGGPPSGRARRRHRLREITSVRLDKPSSSKRETLSPFGWNGDSTTEEVVSSLKRIALP